ncbi:MAG: NHLP bacteriocin system secretion protein [Polymorphobacter sp.]|uniref:NHLP bacteriocin system secretion protein n=1 Tax=Polymorphobacter sp. TaxID=1909290 RepID=UPI003A8A8D7D
MTSTLFRKQALDRLASPERLDAPMTLVPRPWWMLLAAFAAMIVAAALWAGLTFAPVKVGAQGILINRTGLAEIVAEDAGRIEALLVAPGDVVRAGQPIATIARTQLTRELADATSELKAAQARRARLERFYADQAASERQADAARVATIAESRAALEERARFLEEKAAQMTTLVQRGFITRQQQGDLELELAEVRERISGLDEAALRVTIEANARAEKSGLALLDEQRTIDAKAREIARLAARLGETEVIRASSAGQVTEVKLGAGDIIAAGTALATIAPETGGADAGLVALIYVPAAEGKRIAPGMAAEVVPTTVERAVYGHVPGRVLAVAPLPATAEGMRRVLRNDQLVQELTAKGAPIEVRIALERRPGSASGFAWSASEGPDAPVSAGSIVEGKVIVDERRVAALLLPGAAR